MKATTVHVFAGKFRDRDEACNYSQEQWDELASETCDPHWPMRTDLGIEYLDHDFIETTDDSDGINRYDYLRTMLRNPQDIERIRQEAGPEANILVLIFEQALGGFGVTIRSTPRLTYCGAFPARL